MTKEIENETDDLLIDDELIKTLIQKDPNETLVAYAAFRHYAQIPLEERFNITAVNEKVMEMTGAAKETVIDWKKKFRWDERVAQIEAYHFELQFKKRQQILNRDATYFAGKWNAAKHAATDVVEILMEKAKVMLADAEVMKKARPIDALRYVKGGLELIRMAQGLPTEVVEHRIVANSNLDNLSYDELVAEEEELIKAELRITGKSKESIKYLPANFDN